MIKNLLLGMFVLASQASAQVTYKQDVGNIKSLYVSQSGAIAITLDGGFPNANAGGACPSNNGFAGNNAMSATLKAAIIAAKTSDTKILITTLGCESGGAWHKIIDIYLP